MSRQAIVSLVIGEEYQSFWDRHCKDNWEQYADRHDYDIVLINEPIRDDSRTPHWQKLLIFDHPEVQEYDRVVWIDSDIVINYNNSPCIFSEVEDGTIGIVSMNEQLPRQEDMDNALYRSQKRNRREEVRKNAPLNFPEQYAKAGLDDDVEELCNTGVIVMEPSHKNILERTYKNHEATPTSSKENLPLSYEIFKNGDVTRLDTRFNKIFDMAVIQHYPFLKQKEASFSTQTLAFIVNTIFYNSYFLHFIQGHTRDYINMVMPGNDINYCNRQINQHVPDQTFVVGQHEIAPGD